MSAKTFRQQAIVKLIKQQSISCQEQLLKELSELGFEVTQATVSRDIKELSIVKLPNENGGYSYSIPDKTTAFGKTPLELLIEILKQAVTGINFAGNIVVIKCLSGMAQAVCERLDNARQSLVVGTIAGDNTIFVLLKSEQSALELVSKLKRYI